MEPCVRDLVRMNQISTEVLGDKWLKVLFAHGVLTWGKTLVLFWYMHSCWDYRFGVGQLLYELSVFDNSQWIYASQYQSFICAEINLDWYRQQVWKTSTRRDRFANCVLGKTCCEFTLLLHPQERRQGDHILKLKYNWNQLWLFTTHMWNHLQLRG